MADPHVSLRGVAKFFGALRALDGVDLDIAAGRVHALVGENGAGKSTLGKIIAGVHSPDTGSLAIHGEQVRLHGAHDALVRGITTVAQELPLVHRMSVLDNVFLGREPHRAGVTSRAVARLRLDELHARTGFELDPGAAVGGLRTADQQKVAILRALARDAQLIVMDEPTAALPLREARQLLEIIRQLAAAGTTVVYVSHFLDEVLEIADTVTVMRDGHIVRTGPAGAETTDSLVTGMIGRRLTAQFPERQPVAADAPTVLTVSGLGRRGAFADASFTLRRGEILGLAGLVGSGRTEVARVLAGADPADEGRITLADGDLTATHPRGAIDAGIAMIPDDRKELGLLMGATVADNVTVPHLAGLSRAGVIRGQALRATVARVATRAGLSVGGSRRVDTLSGGNQQKVLLGRWLVERPAVLVADEPTRGIDVGAKRAIYDVLSTLTTDGTAVLLISNEVEELIGLAHRILVMRRGRIVNEIDGTEATEELIMRSAFGQDEATDELPAPPAQPATTGPAGTEGPA